MKMNWKRLLPDVAAIVAFILISFVYFFPADIEGRILFQHDTAAGAGASREVNEYYEQTGERSRWTDALFGGMPTYQIAPSYDSTRPLTWMQTVYRLFMPGCVGLVFILMLGFYILLRAFGLPAWLSGLGGVLWAFSSYFFILLSAGHLWKFITLAYIPPMMGGIVLAYRGRLLAGGALTALFVALQIVSNHVQMSYYFLFVVLFVVLAYFMQAWRARLLPQFFRATAVLVLAGLVGVAANLSNLYHTYTYSKETTRGQSELVQSGGSGGTQATGGGLDRAYITQWSYGVGETLTLLVPNFKGGASVPLAASETAMDKADPRYSGIGLYNSLTQYFGDQPMTSGPVYVGAFVLFLFLLGCFIVKGPMKWALLGATLLSVMLSWGKNFMPLTDFFIDYIPMYNKFRAVSSILVVAEFTIPLLAVLALKEVVRRPECLLDKMRPTSGGRTVFILGALTGLVLFYVGFQGGGESVSFGPSQLASMLASAVLTGGYFLLARYVMTRYKGGVLMFTLWQTAGVALLLMIVPSAFSSGFVPAQEMSMLQSAIPAQELQPIVDNLSEMRQALLTADARRSLFIILIGCALLWCHAAGKLRAPLALGGMALLCLIDLWGVNKRYLNDSQFVAPSARTTTFAQTDADKLILQDKDPDYRVLNFAVSTFNDNSTSYWHKSVGGYHPAKLRRYQDLIDRHIAPEMQALQTEVISRNGQMDSVDASKFRVLNMLNTKYFIFPAGQQGQTVPIQNPYAYGNAWFVDRVDYVDGANAEMDAMSTLDLRHEAVADVRFKATLDGAVQPEADSLSVIQLTSYAPNRLTYRTDNARDGVAVFSEIYYPQGWEATIDGKPAEIGRANYVLRAMSVPAGQHEIVMTFDPKSLHVTEAIAYAALVLMFLALAGAALKTAVRGVKQGK